MTAGYFGTDGIRGRAGDTLPPELALRAAAAFARVGERGKKAPIVLGGDPRLSTSMLRAAAASGIALSGLDVLDVGVVPTPLVSFAVLRRSAQGGIMVTASHNPIPDNGLKFFSADGAKIDKELEDKISRQVAAEGWLRERELERFGRISLVEEAQPYATWLQRKYALTSGSRQLKIVLDCAWGATAELAPLAFERCGYATETINAAFDGARVNVKSGTTDLSRLAKRVVGTGADLGIAFDGDGDRMLAVDEQGRTVSGDQIIALFATRLARYRKQRRVAMTHMTNLGVELALARHGVEMVRTEVGDTNVLAALRAYGLQLGGEQSGHLIMLDRLPAGDGIAAGLQLAAIIAGSRRSLHELAAEFVEYPQQLTNLQVKDRTAWRKDKPLMRRIAAIQHSFPAVRFYLRASGTENLLRVLTEADDRQRCLAANTMICDAFREWDAKC